MSTGPGERERELQRLAEAAPAPGEPAGARAYREVYAALRSAPMPEPPPGFATRLARRLAREREAARIEAGERRLVAAALGLLGLGLLGFGGAALASVAASGGLLWPLAACAVLALAAIEPRTRLSRDSARR